MSYNWSNGKGLLMFAKVLLRNNFTSYNSTDFGGSIILLSPCVLLSCPPLHSSMSHILLWRFSLVVPDSARITLPPKDLD